MLRFKALTAVSLFAIVCFFLFFSFQMLATTSKPIAIPQIVADLGFLNSEKELGCVKWIRDYEKGIAESKKSGKPIFLQFQEVPG